MTVVTMFAKAGMSPIATEYQRLFNIWRIGLTNRVARSILILLAVGNGLAIACTNEVGFVTASN